MQRSRQLRLILLLALIVVASFLIIIVSKTQGIISQQTTKKVENTSVAILTSDVLTDQSWGSLAYKGKINIEQKYPVSAQVISEVNTNQKMKEAAEKVIQNGTKVVIGHGREFSTVFTELAPKYPHVHFVTIHGTSRYKNQTVYTFDQTKIEYLAGTAAAMKTRTKKIGLIDAFEAREKNPGFEKGLKASDSSIAFYYRVVNSRDDGAKAVKLLRELKDEGVDIVYAKGNSYNQEVIQEAKKQKMYVIGYLDDQAYMGRPVILTSVINDVPQAYNAIMKDYFSKKGLRSREVKLDARDGVYKLAPFGPMYSKQEKQILYSKVRMSTQPK
ncbi:BMP family ABC transporter substrate-binding protein [Priestia megaterium]|uniref:BMP family ABC transporter substrate-binding protein n=1 Tax=Priestia aryabhattai TaxID=412384 RepID=A0ABD5KLB7_PRIAR|nr:MULTISPECIES: BMP family ABC transporter substrate-binding protein [Priestia]MBK0294988.1 BMP family ABC transporter substrate-binding protein [Bacillus sp. S34]AWD65278.1 BMP family ABC transporter substrate-binding protein [Priestia megaterium]MBY0214108.1 BMP family ABC transporter substrate-binding protein [Priestia aryabhattai]MDC7762173.1 BMP family ABC transporter substrate-binding protein [Priestia aryabhattai]MEB4888526.1 BMP family ABC transporter substrate-binding protein [Priest